MTPFRLDRRAVLQGAAGATLALPVLEAMGKEFVEQVPRRFCALYTANGMSLPKEAHGIAECCEHKIWLDIHHLTKKLNENFVEVNDARTTAREFRRLGSCIGCSGLQNCAPNESSNKRGYP